MSVVVVTGAASGIGAATCHELAGLPDTTVVGIDLAWRRPDPVDVVALTADVSDPTALAAAFDDLDRRDPGTVTGLVCCAGIQQRVPTLELTAEQWHRMLSVHLYGSLQACQLAAVRMTAGGSIVLFSSVAEFFGWPERVAYAVSKAGISALARGLAAEWAPRRIRVNSIAPGYVETPLVRAQRDRGELPDDPARQHALGRMAVAEEIARPVRFLLSADASFITGEVLVADGGYRIFRGR